MMPLISLEVLQADGARVRSWHAERAFGVYPFMTKTVQLPSLSLFLLMMLGSYALALQETAVSWDLPQPNDVAGTVATFTFGTIVTAVVVLAKRRTASGQERDARHRFLN
jgi:hypothetical protein